VTWCKPCVSSPNSSARKYRNGSAAPWSPRPGLPLEANSSAFGKLLTLGQALEPDIATQAAQHGSAMTTIDWARLLRCTECDVRDADFDLTGERQ
jgi:hypothetical protein